MSSDQVHVLNGNKEFPYCLLLSLLAISKRGSSQSMSFYGSRIDYNNDKTSSWALYPHNVNYHTWTGLPCIETGPMLLYAENMIVMECQRFCDLIPSATEVHNHVTVSHPSIRKGLRDWRKLKKTSLYWKAKPKVKIRNPKLSLYNYHPCVSETQLFTSQPRSHRCELRPVSSHEYVRPPHHPPPQPPPPPTPHPHHPNPQQPPPPPQPPPPTSTIPTPTTHPNHPTIHHPPHPTATIHRLKKSDINLKWDVTVKQVSFVWRIVVCQ